MVFRCVVALVCLITILACAGAGGAAPWKQGRIIVTFWLPPPVTDEALARAAAEHFTITWTPESGIEVAARHGLRVMLQDSLLSPASLDDPAKKADLDALIDRVKNHPALEAYYIVDEPNASAFPALGRLVAYLRERDPAHLAYINLFPTYANNDQLGTKGDVVTAYREHLRQYVEIVKPELISYDHYHFFKNRDGDQYFLNLAMIRQAALEAGVPFLNIIQASDGEKVWRFPTGDEMRFLVYTTLAYGGRGISYFVYWGRPGYKGIYDDGKPTEIEAPVAQLNEEIGILSPELMKLDSLGVYHTEPLPLGGEAVPADSPVQIVGPGEFVLGLFGADARVTSFMIANRSYAQRAAARLRVPAGTRRVEEFDRSQKVWRDYTAPGADGAVTVDLKPGDGRLFRLAQ
jgi:hypothetical protein